MNTKPPRTLQTWAPVAILKEESYEDLALSFKLTLDVRIQLTSDTSGS